MGTSETKWAEVVATAPAAAADAAIVKALSNYQTRVGCLPGGYEGEEWEDVYADALCIYSGAVAAAS